MNMYLLNIPLHPNRKAIATSLQTWNLKPSTKRGYTGLNCMYSCAVLHSRFFKRRRWRASPFRVLTPCTEGDLADESGFKRGPRVPFFASPICQIENRTSPQLRPPRSLISAMCSIWQRVASPQEIVRDDHYSAARVFSSRPIINLGRNEFSPYFGDNIPRFRFIWRRHCRARARSNVLIQFSKNGTADRNYSPHPHGVRWGCSWLCGKSSKHLGTVTVLYHPRCSVFEW